MALPWFRMYTEFAGDPVIQSLAFEDQRHYVILLCLKGDGTLDKKLDAETRDRIVRRALGLDQLAASEAKRRLQEVKLINDAWMPTGWDKRQFSSDRSTERVRKFRKKEKRNGTETLHDRSRNAPDTDTDTDTEIKALASRDKPRSAEAPVNGNSVAYIPLNDGSEFGISAEQVSEFEKLYPAVDVPQTLNEIRAWNLTHPDRRKTKRGVMAHVNGWLAKEQNRGPKA